MQDAVKEVVDYIEEHTSFLSSEDKRHFRNIAGLHRCNYRLTNNNIQDLYNMKENLKLEFVEELRFTGEPAFV